MRSAGILLILAGALAVVLPSAAEAAPNRIPPQAIFSNAHISGVRLGVSSVDEALAVIGMTNRPDDAALVSRVRGAGGQFAPVQELTRSNADLPIDVRFNPAGNIFLTWGNGGSGGLSEFATRPRGGLFTAPTTFPAGRCGRYASVRYRADGATQLACDAELAPGPAKFGIATFAGTTPTDILSVLSQSVQAGDATSSYIPRLDIGPDGTRAIIWATSDVEPVTSDSVSSVKIAVAPPGAGFGAAQTVAKVTSDGLEFLSPLEVEVLADGRVAIAYVYFNGRFLTTTTSVAIRTAAGAISSAVLPDNSGSWASVKRDGSDALVAWTTRGSSNPVRGTRVAKLSSSSSGEPLITDVQTLDRDVSLLGVPQLEVSTGGAAALAHEASVTGGNRLSAWTRSARGLGFEGPLTVASAPTISSPRIALDRFGSLAAAWVEAGAPTAKVMFGGLDASGPALSGFSVPGKLRTRRAGSFSVRATDPSGISKARWSFGDRSSATGTGVRHSFPRTGRFRVTVTVTDRAGKQSSASRVVRVTR